MWPIMLSLLNLPHNVRTAFSNILLVGIIPGNGTQEPKSVSPYLEVVADELLELSNAKLFDAYQGAPFQLKVELLLYILDYPGINEVFGVSGSGAYQGCAWCKIKGTYNYYMSTFILFTRIQVYYNICTLFHVVSIMCGIPQLRCNSTCIVRIIIMVYLHVRFALGMVDRVPVECGWVGFYLALFLNCCHQ